MYYCNVTHNNISEPSNLLLDNQLTGFYMRATLPFNGLMLLTKSDDSSPISLTIAERLKKLNCF